MRQIGELHGLADRRTRRTARMVSGTRSVGFSVHRIVLPVEKTGRRRSDVAATEVGFREGGDDERMVVARENVASRNVPTNGGLHLLVGETRGKDEKNVRVVGKGFLLF